MGKTNFLSVIRGERSAEWNAPGRGGVIEPRIGLGVAPNPDPVCEFREAGFSRRHYSLIFWIF
jgi:hypothetical protein